MKICFDFVCDEALLFSEVASRLNQNGIDVCGLTLGNRWSQGWKNKFTTFSLDEKNDKDPDTELNRIIKKYKKYQPETFVSADRFLSKLSRKEQKDALVSAFIATEKAIQSGANIFITTGVAYLYNLVILAVCDMHGAKSISIYGARQATSRFTYSLGRGGRWEHVDDAYKKISNNKTQDLKTELDYVASFREKAKYPDYMNSARQAGGIRYIFIKEFLSRAYNWHFKGWGKTSDYITQNPLWYATRDIKRIAQKARLRNYKFDSPSQSDSYYIYPLHLQPEASTLILGPDYVDQLNTIRLISARIPSGSLLYVKEHPAAYGRHTKKFYKEIQSIFNVRLISPHADTRKLILGSKGVIVISGTMGWEALLLGKPALVLGSVFYEAFRGAHKINCINDLYYLLKDNNPKPPSTEDAAMAVKAVFEGSFPGIFDVHKLDTKSRVLSTINIEQVFNGIHKIIHTT